MPRWKSPGRRICSFSFSRRRKQARRQAGPFWDGSGRKEDRDTPSTVQVRDAQLAAIHAWGTPQGERYARLREIKQPVLVVNGNQDIMIPTINSYILEQHLPNAQLILYPDSGHGSLFQYPELFVEHASLFLRG